MEIEFDPAKDAANRAKHGVSLSVGAEMDLEVALVREDLSQTYGERRWTALGPAGDDLYLMAFALRGVRLRIISIRRADKRDRRRWRDALGQDDG